MRSKFGGLKHRKRRLWLEELSAGFGKVSTSWIAEGTFGLEWVLFFHFRIGEKRFSLQIPEREAALSKLINARFFSQQDLNF